MQITASISGSGGVGVNWQNSTGTSTLTTSNIYSTCIPGNYMAYAYNLAMPTCSVAQLVSVNSNTTPPQPFFTSNFWGVESPTLTCNKPCVILTGLATTASYSVSWETPGT